MKDALRKIIYGAEVTVTFIPAQNKHISCLNKYNSKQYEIVDNDFISSLINMYIIDQNGGNFETHERHYLLNEKFVSIENGVKTIKIDDIWKNILIYNTGYISLPKDHMDKKIENAFLELKIQLLRIEKLKKINGVRKDL